MTVLFQNRYASNADAFCHYFASLRTPPERPAAFRPIVVCKTMTVLFQNRYALNAYAFCHCFASSAHAEKMQALFRLCLLSARRGSQAKPAAQSAGKTLREEKAADFCLSLWRTIRDSNPWPFGP